MSLDYNNEIRKNSQYNGNGALTSDSYLFYETRITAQLMCDGLSRDEIVNKVAKENLFQFPTERKIRSICGSCVKRLNCLNDNTLVSLVAAGAQSVAKQICLYAMMRQYRLVWDFMVTVIGEKYRYLDFSFKKSDLNDFFMEVQSRDEYVASWAEKTVNKIKQIFVRILVENEYLDDRNSTKLNPVLISTVLEDSIRFSGDKAALCAFNCIE